MIDNKTQNSQQKTQNYNPKMEALLNKLINDKIVTRKEVFNAMMQVDRADFIHPDYAYYDW